MKNTWLLLVTIIFFLLVNTSYFWQSKIGIVGIPIFIFFAILFFLLILFLIGEFFQGVKEKFRKKNRKWRIGLMFLLLGLIYLKPKGIIDFDKLEGENLLVAKREGVANCMTTLKLKSNNKFKEINVCFAVNEINGHYEIRNDTIYFYGASASLESLDKEYYKFAIIKKSKSRDEVAVHLYSKQTDTVAKELRVTKNRLVK